jgi:hypothetical protein
VVYIFFDLFWVDVLDPLNFKFDECFRFLRNIFVDIIDVEIVVELRVFRADVLLHLIELITLVVGGAIARVRAQVRFSISLVELLNLVLAIVFFPFFILSPYSQI